MKACNSASELGHRERDAGRLIEAREHFLSCNAAACGAEALRCRLALEQLAQDTPSVVPVVQDASGTPVVDVRVEMDGQILVSRIDGRALPVNPGLHEFAFSTSAGLFYEEKVLIVAGQRNQHISAQWAPPVASAPSPAVAEPAITPAPGPSPEPAPAPVDARATGGGSPSTLTYVVGGVGVAAIGSSLLFAAWGSDDNKRLNRCAPNCSPDGVDHVKNLYIASDVTMGVGVVALGLATWFLVSDLTAPSGADSGTGLRVDVQPLASGAYATVGGAF